MVKELRSQGSGSSDAKIPSRSQAKKDSRQTGEGSSSGDFYVNERGEVCYGDNCFTLAIDQERGEVRVNIKRDAACNVEPLVEALRETLAKGARTVYEVESSVRE